MTTPNPLPPETSNDDMERNRKSLYRSGIVAVIGALISIGLVFYTFAANSDQDRRIQDGEQRLAEQTQVIEKQNIVIGQVCKVAGGQVDETDVQQYCSRVESGLPAVPIAINVGVKRCDLDLRLADGSTTVVGVLCEPPLTEITVTEGGRTKRCTGRSESDTKVAYVCVPLDIVASTVGTTQTTASR